MVTGWRFGHPKKRDDKGFLLPFIISPPIMTTVAKSRSWKPMVIMMFDWSIRSWIVKVEPVGLSRWIRNRRMITRTEVGCPGSLMSRSWRRSPTIGLREVFRIIGDPTSSMFCIVPWCISFSVLCVLFSCLAIFMRSRLELIIFLSFLEHFLLGGWWFPIPLIDLLTYNKHTIR